MTVGELRKKLDGVPDDMPVEMADFQAVTVAEAMFGTFIVSDGDEDAHEMLEAEKRLAEAYERHNLGPIR
jgi:hypothetical protein